MTDPNVASLLLEQAAASTSADEFLPRAIEIACDSCGAAAAILVRAARGKWDVLASIGSRGELPVDLLAEALDADHIVATEAWVAAPLEPRASGGELIAFQIASESADQRRLVKLIADFRSALASVRRHGRQLRRIERLETILSFAAQWNATLETGVLLVHMAEASTRLLKSERASIFLWDRLNKQLVGRPALGVEGEELRISDDAGVVGQVVHTGETRRVDADEGDVEIDRSVDEKLEFRTRNLLCVPLRQRDGQILGAFEMLNKIGGNFNDDDETALKELAAHASIALENSQQYEQLLRVRNQMADQAASAVRLIGHCPAIESLRSTIGRIADTDLAILILGENGTGKEVVSQLVHYLSQRRNEPFVAVNCAALSESLLESELFGHEKGAFTDAHEARAGKFELADGGTLFLDEIGDMSLGGQAKLLRVLEEKVVVRVGGSTPIHTDARVLAATNQNLAEMVSRKKFREDLFFRLNVVTLDIPPLRQRGEDVLLLAQHFLADFCTKARRKPPQFTAAARKRLLGHSWPGNVRELRNLMERLAYLSQGDTIDADDLAFILMPRNDSSATFSLDESLKDATRRFQAQLIQRQIDAARGNMTAAAARLHLHRSNLYRKMRQLGMDTSED